MQNLTFMYLNKIERNIVCAPKSSSFQMAILIKYKHFHFSTTTVSRKYQLVVDVYVTAMPTFALLQAMQCYNVNVNTTPQVKNFVQTFVMPLPWVFQPCLSVLKVHSQTLQDFIFFFFQLQVSTAISVRKGLYKSLGEPTPGKEFYTTFFCLYL